MRWRRLPDPATIAGLFVVWAVAWSVTPGRIAEDTKNDLYVDPWGFLGRALHLWDPQVTWGGLSNQGYGYLFPMGPFFGLGSEIAPVWVVQRLWWSVLLTAGLLGMAGLLRALEVGTPRTRIVGALAYVLAPRVVSSIAGLSAEIAPQLLAPLVVWPLVLAAKGRLSTARAVTLSGIAALCCGGVNATATLSALVPAGLWLITRHRWWRAPLTWSWVAAMVAATAWWLGPLIVMARFAPPFLDWIENAQAVMRPVGMLDVVRGTTHWLGHIVTPGGPWWPAGYELVTRPSLIVLTTLVAALGLGGLARAGVPERRWLWTSLVVGGVLLLVAHDGPLGSPIVGQAQAALDGPLAPLRNIHKLDLLVRLPLAVGLTHLLGRLASSRTGRTWTRPVAVGAVVLAVIGAAAPGFTGATAVRGSFERMPKHWVDAGRWLDSHDGDGQTLVVPAANFGEYYWGRPIDEPLRPLTKAAYAVRDAVPLAPAGTIRLLDEIERRLQSGRSLDGGADVLLRAGVRHLVVRNDLATAESGQPPVALARSSVRSTDGVTFAKGFGQTFIDASGERVFPVEVYALAGRASTPLELWRTADVSSASGASEDLVSIADAGLLDGPVVFDGDRADALDLRSRVVTDGYRARQRWFGAPRGQDLTNTLTAGAGRKAPDYLPWGDLSLRSSVTYRGISGVSASSSMAEDLGFAGLRPGNRPFAAVDGDPDTAWAAMWDEHPRLTIDLPAPAAFDHVILTGLARDATLGKSVSRPTRVRVSTDQGSVTADLGAGPSRVDLPQGEHTKVDIEVLATEREQPDRVVTGFSEVTIPGVRATEVVRLPSDRAGPESAPTTDAIVLGAGLRGRDGCTKSDREFVCIGGQGVGPEQTGALVREVSGSHDGQWQLSGALGRGAGPATAALLESPDVSVRASSVRTDAPQAAATAIVDGDDRTAWSPAFDDETPELTFDFDRDVTVETLRLQTRRDWDVKAAPAVVIDIGGREFTRRVQAGGVVQIPPTSGARLRLEFVRVPGENAASAPNAALELEALDIGGFTPARPSDRVQAACGQGPTVTVDGRSVRTSASITRDQLFGVGSGSWSACGPVEFSSGDAHSVSVGTWQGFTARSAVLTRDQTKQPAVPRQLTTDREGSTWRSNLAASGEERLLVMDQNANRGWQARVGERSLAAQTVDGRRQGFVVPPGTAGRVEITFGPDATYRAALLAGLALAVGLVGACLLALLRTRSAQARAEAATGSLLAGGASGTVAGVVLAVALGAVVAGPAGAGATLVGVALARLLRHRLGAAVGSGIVVIAVVVCGVTQALLAPGSLGGSVLEGTIRMVLLVVVALAATLATGEEPRREA